MTYQRSNKTSSPPGMWARRKFPSKCGCLQWYEGICSHQRLAIGYCSYIHLLCNWIHRILLLFPVIPSHFDAFDKSVIPSFKDAHAVALWTHLHVGVKFRPRINTQSSEEWSYSGNKPKGCKSQTWRVRRVFYQFDALLAHEVHRGLANTRSSVELVENTTVSNLLNPPLPRMCEEQSQVHDAVGCDLVDVCAVNDAFYIR